MKTLTTLKNLFGNLSNNTSTDNLSLGEQLINDQHRYLIQKYFDNERTVQTTTVGAQDLTLTGALSVGAVSATLSSAWTYPTVTQLTNFSSGEQRSVLFTNGSTAITWAGALTQTATTDISTVGVQDYLIPANVSKLINDTITVGQLRYTPIEIKSRTEWDLVNTLPYTSDIPQYYYIYNSPRGNNLGIWPIPSTTGNILTFNYKTRVADLNFADYSTGTISTATAGSTSITGSSTAWSATGGYPLNTDIGYFNLCLKITPPKGDGIWYPISRFNSDTSLTLANPIINAPNISSASYVIGQIPILSEDFHDMLVYGALMTYYSSINPDTGKFNQFKALYDDRLGLLADYAGTKAVNTDLGGQPQFENPNLYLYANN